MKTFYILVAFALTVGCSSESTQGTTTPKASKTKASKTKGSKGQKASKSSASKGQKTSKSKGGTKTANASANPEQAVAVTADKVISVQIKVEKKKANGKSWDALFGKPDIAFCVESGERIDCFPEGKTLKKLKKPKCKNALTCSADEIPISGETVKISIVDIDKLASDKIGSADCPANGSECKVGRATVTVSTPRLNRAARRAESKKRYEKMLAEQEKARKIANPDRPDYPVACKGLDTQYNAKITGDKSGLCLPNNLYDLAKVGVFAHKVDRAPYKYKDDAPLAILRAPEKQAGESSRFSDAKRKKLAKDALSKLYWTDGFGGFNCSFKLDDKENEIQGECRPSSGFFVNGRFEVTKKKGKCEDIGGKCPGRCETDRDCNKITCGCDESKCLPYSKKCSRCPRDVVCDDPTFPQAPQKSWTFSRTLKTPKEKTIAKAMIKSSNRGNILFFRIKDTYRKVFYGRKDGKTVVQHDSGYRIKIEPQQFIYRNKTNGDILTVFSKGKLTTTYDKRWKDGKATPVKPISSITCIDGTCTSKLSSP